MRYSYIGFTPHESFIPLAIIVERRMNFSSDLLLRKLIVFDSSPGFEELLDLPLTYEGYKGEHVQLVILKLSDMDPDELKHNLEAARMAYRDELVWSEHPV